MAEDLVTVHVRHAIPVEYDPHKGVTKGDVDRALLDMDHEELVEFVQLGLYDFEKTLDGE